MSEEKCCGCGCVITEENDSKAPFYNEKGKENAFKICFDCFENIESSDIVEVKPTVTGNKNID
jgi:hypothetical protein